MANEQQQPGKFGDQNRPDDGVQEIIAENDQESADDDEYRESIDLQLYNENNGASGADMFSQAYQYKESPNSASRGNPKWNVQRTDSAVLPSKLPLASNQDLPVGNSQRSPKMMGTSDSSQIINSTD